MCCSKRAAPYVLTTLHIMLQFIAHSDFDDENDDETTAEPTNIDWDEEDDEDLDD
jgi:hypothetical protein